MKNLRTTWNIGVRRSITEIVALPLRESGRCFANCNEQRFCDHNHMNRHFRHA